MPGDADLAAFGSVLSDPGRCRVLLALGDGRERAGRRGGRGGGACPASTSISRPTDHLAGRLGVDLMRALIDREIIAGGGGRRRDGEQPSTFGREVDYRLTDRGAAERTAFGVAWTRAAAR